MRRVAFQGAAGAYGEEAVRRVCGDAVTPIACRENRDVARCIAAGRAELGVLPIENTLAGSVHVSYDAIIGEPEIHAIGDVVLPIHHCVLGVPGASMESVRVVESHPVALAQCTTFFTLHPSIEARAAYNTAGAAADVSAANDPVRAAIASRAAGLRYGLEVLASDVEDRADNRTRFLVLSRTPATFAPDAPARTLLVVTTPDQPGALLRLLVPLAERRLNLVKLESRPTGEPWTYRFILEFEHRAGDPCARDATTAIAVAAHSCRLIGTYETGIGRAERRS